MAAEEKLKGKSPKDEDNPLTKNSLCGAKVAQRTNERFYKTRQQRRQFSPFPTANEFNFPISHKFSAHGGILAIFIIVHYISAGREFSSMTLLWAKLD